MIYLIFAIGAVAVALLIWVNRLVKKNDNLEGELEVSKSERDLLQEVMYKSDSDYARMRDAADEAMSYANKAMDTVKIRDKRIIDLEDELLVTTFEEECWKTALNNWKIHFRELEDQYHDLLTEYVIKVKL
jgi:hypothetical protein